MLEKSFVGKPLEPLTILLWLQEIDQHKHSWCHNQNHPYPTRKLMLQIILRIYFASMKLQAKDQDMEIYLPFYLYQKNYRQIRINVLHIMYLFASKILFKV